MKEMNYTEFKNGDVIVFEDYSGDERFIIFDRIEKNV